MGIEGGYCEVADHARVGDESRRSSFRHGAEADAPPPAIPGVGRFPADDVLSSTRRSVDSKNSVGELGGARWDETAGRKLVGGLWERELEGRGSREASKPMDMQEASYFDNV